MWGRPPATTAVAARAASSMRERWINGSPPSCSVRSPQPTRATARADRSRLGVAYEGRRRSSVPATAFVFEPHEDHCHGAAPSRFMVHLALNEVDADHVAA